MPTLFLTLTFVLEMETKRNKEEKVGGPIILGIVLGVFLGILTDQYALWISLGLCLGAGIGVTRYAKTDGIC